MSLFPHGHRSGMFIQAPVDIVADCLVAWGNEEIVGRSTTAERKQLSLEEAWEWVGERKVPPDRGFLIPIAGWTAFFDNNKYEWLAAAKLYVLCKRLRVDTCFFSYDDQPETEHCGSAQFNFCRYVAGGEFPVKERQVLLLKESGWKFQESGDALPFEKVDGYAARKKRDRLNADVLRAYGEALDIPFWDADAYGQDVRLLKWGKHTAADTDSTLRKIMKIFGRPSLIMDRDGIRRPPD